jgi:hypothetical protein
LIEIETLKTYAGEIPKNQRKKVVTWAEDNKPILSENFKRLNPDL